MSLYDILSQVAEIWDTLTTNEKDYYLLQQAGGLAPLSSEYAGTNHHGKVKSIRIGESAGN